MGNSQNQKGGIGNEVWEAVIHFNHPILQLCKLRPEKENGLNSLVAEPRPANLSICVFFPLYLRWKGEEEIKILPCAAYQGWQWRTNCCWQQGLNNLYPQVQTETTKGRKREHHGWQVIPCAETLLFSNDDTALICPPPRPCRSQGHKWDVAPALFEFPFYRAP